MMEPVVGSARQDPELAKTSSQGGFNPREAVRADCGWLPLKPSHSNHPLNPPATYDPLMLPFSSTIAYKELIGSDQCRMEELVDETRLVPLSIGSGAPQASAKCHHSVENRWPMLSDRQCGRWRGETIVSVANWKTRGVKTVRVRLPLTICYVRSHDCGASTLMHLLRGLLSEQEDEAYHMTS